MSSESSAPATTATETPAAAPAAAATPAAAPAAAAAAPATATATPSASSSSPFSTSAFSNPFAAFASSAPSKPFNPLVPSTASDSQTAANAANTANPEEEINEGVTFTPILKVGEVDVKSGEEDDDVFYLHRALLYRFDANEWKERGKGDCKLLKSRTTGIIRILLRQEKTLKCCMNHIVQSDIPLKPHPSADRIWTWAAMDFANGSPEKQSFAIKFKDAAIANEFKGKFDEAREINKKIKEEKKEKTAEK